MKRLSVFATLPSLDSVSLNDSVEQTTSDFCLTKPLVANREPAEYHNDDTPYLSGFNKADLRSLRRIYRCPLPEDNDASIPGNTLPDKNSFYF